MDEGHHSISEALNDVHVSISPLSDVDHICNEGYREDASRKHRVVEVLLFIHDAHASVFDVDLMPIIHLCGVTSFSQVMQERFHAP